MFLTQHTVPLTYIYVLTIVPLYIHQLDVLVGGAVYVCWSYYRLHCKVACMQVELRAEDLCLDQLHLSPVKGTLHDVALAANLRDRSASAVLDIVQPHAQVRMHPMHAHEASYACCSTNTDHDRMLPLFSPHDCGVDYVLPFF